MLGLYQFSKGNKLHLQLLLYSWLKDSHHFYFLLKKHCINIRLEGYIASYVVCVSNRYFLGGKEMVATDLLFFWREPPHISVSFDAGTSTKGN